jgi:ketosteroid isomerase-like protein
MVEAINTTLIANDWCNNWNRGNVEYILDACTEDVAFLFPTTLHWDCSKGDVIKGKEAVKNFLARSMRSEHRFYFQMVDVTGDRERISALYRMDGKLIAFDITLDGNLVKSVTAYVE